MKESKKYAALYVRVSTDAQFEEGYSVDAQKEMLEAYCKTKSIRDFEYYVDGGFSGSNIDRPEMKRLVDDAKANKLQCVVVYKLDRMSRSQKDTLFLIEDIFLPHNVDFVSLNENLDTSSPYGRAMIGILSAFAQLERETIRERTRMGMKERIKSGLWMGGGRIPFGYDYDKNTGLLVPNADAETVRKIYDLYLQGYSTGRIAQMVGLKYERLAIQILTRKSNTGYILYNGEEYRGLHEPIIDEETYARAMELMKERSVNRAYQTNYLLSGMIFCGVCGAKMRYQKWGKQGCKIVCYSQDKHKQHLIKDPNCDNSRLWAEEVENLVINGLLEFSRKLKSGGGALSQLNELSYNALELLKKQYESAKNKITKLYLLYAEQDDEFLLEAIETAKQELAKIQESIDAEEQKGAYTKKAQLILETVEKLSEIWDYATKQEQRNIVRQCVEKVVITGEDVYVHYKLDYMGEQ